jgi:hypothetical protein
LRLIANTESVPAQGGQVAHPPVLLRPGVPARGLATTAGTAARGGYIDAVAFELLPAINAINERTDVGSVRTRAAVRLYASISENRGRSLGLHLTV